MRHWRTIIIRLSMTFWVSWFVWWFYKKLSPKNLASKLYFWCLSRGFLDFWPCGQCDCSLSINVLGSPSTSTEIWYFSSFILTFMFSVLILYLFLSAFLWVWWYFRIVGFVGRVIMSFSPSRPVMSSSQTNISQFWCICLTTAPFMALRACGPCIQLEAGYENWEQPEGEFPFILWSSMYI